jgi:hypothetical protein
MAMMTAYFDDSGTHKESDIAVAACLVSDDRRWDRFGPSWNRVLEEAGMADDGFHMAEFVAHKPPFDAWDAQRREAVIKALISTINRHALVGMATAVVKTDYDRFVTGELRRRLGDLHYTFAVESCLAFVEEWMKRTSLVQPVYYVFDAMGKGRHEIADLFEDIIDRKLGTHFGIEPSGYAFGSRRSIVQLQAADILAWEANKYMRDHQFTAKTPRKSFQSMVDGVPDGIRARFFDFSSLPGLVAELREKYEAVNWEGPLGGFI